MLENQLAQLVHIAQTLRRKVDYVCIILKQDSNEQCFTTLFLKNSKYIYGSSQVLRMVYFMEPDHLPGTWCLIIVFYNESYVWRALAI